jgi:hypothetical protein
MAYATESEAATYMATRVGSEPWDDASPEERTKALGHATTILDRLNYSGEKTSTTQDNEFPRGTDTEVPQDIKDACAEIALALLDGVDPQLEYENIFMASMGYGGVRSAFESQAKPPHILAGVPSFTAWTFIQPYLRDPLNVDLYRTS